MSYEKQNFTDGQVLKAEHLNYIEDALAKVANAEYISPVVDVTELENGYEIIVIDANGEESFIIPKGITPEKGVDYWTDEDRSVMVNDVLAALPVYNGEVETV